MIESSPVVGPERVNGSETHLFMNLASNGVRWSVGGFKALNDAYGHATGDRLLNLVAARLSHAVRAEDLMSRLGGDEYACLITGVSSRERLQQIATTLFEAVSHAFTIGTLVLTVRRSIGIAVYPNDGITANALLQAANSAMYQAKRSKSCARLPRNPTRRFNAFHPDFHCGA